MYNFVSEEKIFLKFLRLISVRLKFILTAKIFLLLCCLFLSGLSIYALYIFLLFGDVFKIRVFLKIFIFSVILFIPVSVFVGFLKKVQLKYGVDKIDCFLSLDDRLNACFEIVTRKSDWGDWNFPLLADTSKKIARLSLETISIIFPLKCKTAIIVFNLLICFLAGVWGVGHSEIGAQWRKYRLRSYLLVQSQIFFNYSNKISGPRQNKLSVSLQKTARTIEKSARVISKKNIFPVKKNLVGNIDVFLKKNLKIISDKNIADKSVFTEINNRLSKIKDDLSNHWNTTEISSKNISGAGTGEKGVGKTKGEIGNGIEKISKTAKKSYRKIELVKQGNNLDNSLETELIKLKKISKNYETDMSAVKKSKYGRAVYPDKKIFTTNDKFDNAVLIHLDGDIILNPVWIDAVPPDRRECVKKYFSAEDKIRSYNNEE